MEMNHNYPMNRGYHGLPNQLKIAHICLPGLGVQADTGPE